MRFLFTNLTMLAGLAGLAIPILIHLLLRRKRRRQRFSTLQFFARQDEQASQRRKLRNLLLLAVRLLLLTLLVLAFARPYLARNQAGDPSQPRRAAVFVLDRTASMQATDAGAARWERARQAIEKALAGLGPNDRAALIGVAAQAETLSGLAPAEAISRLLKDLKPSSGGGSLEAGLRLARQVVAGAGPEVVSTLYVASDFQSSGCANLGASPLPLETEVRPLPAAGDMLAPNLGLAALQLDNRDGERPHLVIARHTEEEFKTVKIRITVDDKEWQTRPVALSTGKVTRVDLALPALTPGWHSAVARLEADDALALDNLRYEAFFTPQPVRCLVAETRPGRRVFEEESFFVVSALNPMQDLTNAGGSRFVVEKAAPDALASRLAARSPAAGPDLVILPGLRRIPAGLTRELTAFVQGGGGLLLFLGDNVDAAEYNREWAALLPGQLGHLERNRSELPGDRWRLDDYDLASPVFSIFRRPGSGNLALPEFTRRFTLATNPPAVVPARFAEGVPALALQAVGRGRVALVNTSADTAWTDWPKHKTYVPWLHTMGLHLAGNVEAGQSRAAAHLAAGDDVEVSLGGAARGKTFRVTRPGKEEASVVADSSGRLELADFRAPGVFTIRDAAGQEVQRLAVNMPPVESDLAALTPGEFQRQLSRTPEPRAASLAAGLFGSGDSREELWRLLLLAVLGLLFAEVFLANRTYA